jgi:hypothetical protein
MARALPSALLEREAGVLPWLGASLLAHAALLGVILLVRGMGGGPVMLPALTDEAVPNR